MSRKKAPKKEESEEPIQYIYTFELIRHYPHSRSFIMKQPMKTSFRDSMFELVFGKK